MPRAETAKLEDLKALDLTTSFRNSPACERVERLPGKLSFNEARNRLERIHQALEAPFRLFNNRFRSLRAGLLHNSKRGSSYRRCFWLGSVCLHGDELTRLESTKS